MIRWYSCALLVIAGLVPMAHAQPRTYSPVGAARMVDLPDRPPKKPLPDLAPGPITPDIAPMGPSPELSLSANHISAFQCEQFPIEEAFFASLGAMGMKRDRPGHLQIAFREAGTVDQNPLVAYPFLRPSARPALQDQSAISPEMSYGPRVTLGYLQGNQAFELLGWYIHPNAQSVTTTQIGQLTVPFGTLSRSIPAGFEGNQNLWVNADRVTTSLVNQLGSVEMNYRTWNSGINNVELILGLRYVHSLETLNITTNDEIRSSIDARGTNDPRLIATYVASSLNNMIAAQFGGEYSTNCPIPGLDKFLWFTAQGKAGLGPNVIQRRYKLLRGDGLSGVNASQNDYQLGQIYEVNAALDFHILDRLRMRLAYQALWLGGVSTPGAQVNFDLSRQGSQPLDYNFQFFHGPVLEFQFLF